MENLKEFWENVPKEIREELTEFAAKSLNIENKEDRRKFIEEYAKIYEQYNHIEDVQTRYQLAYGLVMKKYRLTGGGGDVPTRIKPFSISDLRKVAFKSDGTEHVVCDVRGLARREDVDGSKMTYVVATFWDSDAVEVKEEMKPNVEYKTKLIWKVDKNTGSKSLTTARGSQLILEPQSDEQFPSIEEFVNLALQDSTKVISGLDDLLNYEKVASLGIYSKSPTDIKVIPYTTVIDTRLIEKNGRKLGLMEVIDKSIFTERDKSLIFWTDENQLVGRGSIIHLIGEVRVNTDVRNVTFNPHFIYPVKAIEFINDTPPIQNQPQEQTPTVVDVSETEETKETKDIKVGEAEFDEEFF